jgi:hypothetical protein
MNAIAPERLLYDTLVLATIVMLALIAPGCNYLCAYCLLMLYLCVRMNRALEGVLTSNRHAVYRSQQSMQMVHSWLQYCIYHLQCLVRACRLVHNCSSNHQMYVLAVSHALTHLLLANDHMIYTTCSVHLCLWHQCCILQSKYCLL